MNEPVVLFSEAGFEITIIDRAEPKIACLKFKGDCSNPAFNMKTREIQDKLDALGFDHILMDTSELTHINSRFIGVILSFVPKGTHVGLKSPSKFFSDLLEAVGILQMFDIFDDFQPFAAECRR